MELDRPNCCSTMVWNTACGTSSRAVIYHGIPGRLGIFSHTLTTPDDDIYINK